MKEIKRVANLGIGKKNYKNKIIKIKDHNCISNDYFLCEQLKISRHNSDVIKQNSIKNKKFGVF